MKVDVRHIVTFGYRRTVLVAVGVGVEREAVAQADGCPDRERGEMTSQNTPDAPASLMETSYLLYMDDLRLLLTEPQDSSAWRPPQLSEPSASGQRASRLGASELEAANLTGDRWR